MGKREVLYVPLWQMAIGMVVVPIIFIVYIFLWSMPVSQVESKYNKEAEYKVESIVQIQLPGNGLAVVSANTNDETLMQIYAKVPLLNRYIYTESYNYDKRNSSNMYVVKVWTGHAKLQWDNKEVAPTTWTEDSGWGVQGPILFRFFALELFIVSTALIRNDIVKTRKEKAANPVKNY